jgi:hypothetical protein
MKQASSRALTSVCFMLVSCLAYSLTLKMESICSPEMSVGFHLTTWHFIAEEKTLRSHRLENLNSNLIHVDLH